MSLEPYQDRFGRARPVVAVVAHNAWTEQTDFLIPFGVLSRVADVQPVTTGPGPARLTALRYELGPTLAEFDQCYPEGADYVVIPALKDPAYQPLLEWVRLQADKGGTLVSICLGAMVLANTGLLSGRRATSYFGREAQLKSAYPDVQWQSNIRYVADGRCISSAGISASLPLSLALVEAMAGRARALEVARELGVEDWSPRHDSDAFREGPAVSIDPPAEHDAIGIPVRDGDDEIALALTAEPYTFTGRSKPYVLSDARLAHGVRVLAEPYGDLARTLPGLRTQRVALALDDALAAIALEYGPEAARRVARTMEYPGLG